MKTSSITLRLNDDLKQEATVLAKELGLSLSNIVSGYLKTFVRTREISFSAPKEEPSEYLLQSLEESKKDIENGDVVSFTSYEDALSYLDTLTIHDKED